MVRIAAVGAALIAIGAAAPAIPAGAQISRIPDHEKIAPAAVPFPARSGEVHTPIARAVATPRALETPMARAVETPMPRSLETPTPVRRAPIPRQAQGGRNRHGVPLPANIMSRWLFGRPDRTPSRIESDARHGAKRQVNPDFPLISWQINPTPVLNNPYSAGNNPYGASNDPYGAKRDAKPQFPGETTPTPVIAP